MIFEMSDDESMSSKHSAAIAGSGSNEHLASSKMSNDHQRMVNDHPFGQFYRSSRQPSVISESIGGNDVNVGTANNAELVSDIRDQLRELRETKETPKYSLVKGD